MFHFVIKTAEYYIILDKFNDIKEVYILQDVPLSLTTYVLKCFDRKLNVNIIDPQSYRKKDFANSAALDETPRNAASHLGVHCLCMHKILEFMKN